MIAWPVWLLYIYGVLLIGGGAMGYVKAKSKPSLIAGTVCGLIAIFLGYDYTWHFAPDVALLLSILLIYMMGKRYLNTRQAMPALLIVAMSLVVALVQVYVIFFVGVGHDPL